MSPDNNEPLLKKHGMLHISQMLVLEKVSDLRAAVASATFKTPWLPEFVCRDILKVLHEEHRVKRKQLLDALVIGMEVALLLPKLKQARVLIVWGSTEQSEIVRIRESCGTVIGHRCCALDY